MGTLYVHRRSMQRAPRPPKRSPTPTNGISADAVSPTSPSSPDPTPQKPLFLCSPFVEAALVKGNFKTIVMQPKYTDIMEWVAVNSEQRAFL
jgi:MOB kinase activator 1